MRYVRMLVMGLAIVVGLLAISNGAAQADDQLSSLVFAFGIGSMVTVDLKQVYRTKAGKAYRPGRARQMPLEDAQELGLVDKSGNPPSSGAAGQDDDIPDDFPGAKNLKKAGFTMEDVRGATREDLLTVWGIGETTADEILAAREQSSE